MSEETQGAQLSANVGDSPAPAASGSEAASQPAPAPAAANAAPVRSEASEPFHKNPRFQELVSEKNELKEKVSQMERLLQEKLEPKGPSAYDVSKKDLLELGVQEAAAEKMLRAIDRIAEARAEERVRTVEQKTSQQEIDGWISEFSRTHADFKKVEPVINEVFRSLPKQTQMLVASDPMGLDLMYAYVKEQNSKAILDEAYQRGVADGYKGKANKSSVTPGLSGSTNPPSGEFTRENIGKMSMADYLKRRDEIKAALKAGLIPEA